MTSMTRSFQRFSALLYKEMVQILRDRRTLMLFFLLPVIELFLFAYAVSLNVYHLPTALVDQSMDVRSRDFVDALVKSNYFDITQTYQNEQQVIQAIDAGEVKAGVIIPPNFAEDVNSGQGNVLILLDGSDSFSVQSGYNGASAITQAYSINLTTQAVKKSGGGAVLLAGVNNTPITTATRVLYNPDLRDLVFLLPGLIALIIQNIIVAHSAMAVVREREVGTFEQILATPARPIEMILSKLIPGMLVVMVDMAFILTLGVFWFNVPINGSIVALVVWSLLFIVSGMALGLLISSVSKTQRQAQQITAVLNMFTLLLSGFIYSRSSMPVWTQIVGDIIPLTFYLKIIRGIITKGVGSAYLTSDILALAIYSVVALVFAAAVFKKRLD
jgi:ABC-2 type transport system permease protein